MMHVSTRLSFIFSLALAAVVSSPSWGQFPVRWHRPTLNRQSLQILLSGPFGKSPIPNTNRLSKSRNVAASQNAANQTRNVRQPQQVSWNALPASRARISQAQYIAADPAATYSSTVRSGTYGCTEIPNEVCAPPLGSTINAYFDSHVFNGEKARLMLYHYDFNNGPLQDQSQLNAAGRKKIASLKNLLTSSGHPLMVQRVENDIALSQARQSHVTGVLQSEFGLSGTQVIVRDSDSGGINGMEAIDLDLSRQQMTRALGDTQSGFRSTSASSVSNAQRPRER